MHRIPYAASPGLSPKLGRGLFYLRLGIELIADACSSARSGAHAARAW